MKNRQERQISFLVVWLTMFSFKSGYGQDFYKQELKVGFLEPDFSRWMIVPMHPKSAFYGPPGLNSAYSEKTSPSLSAGYFEPDLWDKMKGQKDVGYGQPSNFYYLQSGFFCKREWELEKATHIPFRFRLGSLADCNAMEGKH
jgi:hypothetical protein